jgi:polyvinyl alcohol dehydrogenase (cytochrome)
MVPDNGGQPGGYSGGAVWGSTPALDPAHHAVYVTTGNNYEVPDSVDACVAGGGTPAQCLDPADHIDSIVALDMRSGAIRWASGPAAFDTWNIACVAAPPPNNCPDNPGADNDFAQGAQLFTVPDGHHGTRQLVGAGQKSGVYWAVDARTGTVVWSAAVGPGSPNGGMQWGSATDGKRIYVQETDAARVPYTLPDGQQIAYSSFAALDPATGRILWQVPEPHQGFALSALSTANGVVYAGSHSGHLYALDAATGAVRWDQPVPGATIAGPALVDGTAYWGIGYSNHLGGPAGATAFYAFSLPH